MNSIAIVFVVTNAVALLTLPRRWAPLPLLAGACYMTLGQEIELGGLHFTVIRILVAVGLVRVILRGERIAGVKNSLDLLMVVWAAWALFSSFFHNDSSGALIFRLGMVYNACGIYFLLRVFCRSYDDVVGLCRITAILLVPVALEMLSEKLTSYNYFSILEGISDIPSIREGRIRAQGPFAHSILAGTIGAVCLPFAVALWQQHRKVALLGIGASIIMIFAAASSGPIISAVAAVGALWMWRYRQHMRLMRWLAVLGYLGLDLIMKAPAYYLISRIDLAGGSTGWHRARLIQSAFEHLSEWWFAGTDYTRNWTAVEGYSADQTDITNHYLYMGVLGGLPLMLLFIAILARAFFFVGKTLRRSADLGFKFQFIVWALGASLFAHAATFISVAYFDQSYVFLYLTLAAISSVWSASTRLESYNVGSATGLALTSNSASRL